MKIIESRQQTQESEHNLPGISAHDFRSTSRTYVESFASVQIDKWRDIGDVRFLSHPVMV